MGAQELGGQIFTCLVAPDMTFEEIETLADKCVELAQAYGRAWKREKDRSDRFNAAAEKERQAILETSK